MMTMEEDQKPKPWHKEYYVWFVIFFPALAVVAGIYTIYLAVSSDDGLVVDDYYKKGLEINRTLERDQIATEYALDADIRIDPQFEEVTIKLSSNSNFVYPSQLEASFLYATRSGLDQKVKLLLTDEQTYRGNLAALAPGKWYVQIQKDNWRLTNTIFVK